MLKSYLKPPFDVPTGLSYIHLLKWDLLSLFRSVDFNRNILSWAKHGGFLLLFKLRVLEINLSQNKLSQEAILISD